MANRTRRIQTQLSVSQNIITINEQITMGNPSAEDGEIPVSSTNVINRPLGNYGAYCYLYGSAWSYVRIKQSPFSLCIRPLLG